MCSIYIIEDDLNCHRINDILESVVAAVGSRASVEVLHKTSAKTSIPTIAKRISVSISNIESLVTRAS